MWATLIAWAWPIGIGAAFYWFAGKCRGKNGRAACSFTAWGFWFYLLTLAVSWIFPLSLLLYLPSVLCFWLAGASLLKEMKAQQRGEYTDVV